MHTSVLLQETIDNLDLKKGDSVLDGTINNAGHSLLIAERIGERGVLIGLDEDRTALVRAKENLASLKHPPRIELVEENFRNLDTVLDSLKIPSIDKIIFDIGLSSDQLEVSGRGFSFKRDEPLLMTMSAIPRLGQRTALEIVNSWSEEELADAIFTYGEERFSRRIAKGIVEARSRDLITTTGTLEKIIKDSVPAWYARGKIHPATKTFQGIRICVNDELNALAEGLKKGVEKLSSGGRIAVITFHSLEDRIVKNFFRDMVKTGSFIAITKKPIVPKREEVLANPRSRSAKLRVLLKK